MFVEKMQVESNRKIHATKMSVFTILENIGRIDWKEKTAACISLFCMFGGNIYYII